MKTKIFIRYIAMLIILLISIVYCKDLIPLDQKINFNYNGNIMKKD